MDRKEFLTRLVQIGTGAALVGSLGASSENAIAASAESSPCMQKMDFVHQWLKWNFDDVDALLDETARKKLVRANGRKCAAARAMQRWKAGELDKYLEHVVKEDGPGAVRREGNIIHFTMVSDNGHCLCPLVAASPSAVSPTFCECSVGYVTALFEHLAGRPVKVELTESILRGGKGCRFVINV